MYKISYMIYNFLANYFYYFLFNVLFIILIINYAQCEYVPHMFLISVHLCYADAWNHIMYIILSMLVSHMYIHIYVVLYVVIYLAM